MLTFLKTAAPFSLPLLLLVGCTSAPPAPEPEPAQADPAPAPLVQLRTLAQKRGLELGVAVDFKMLANAKYAGLVASEFSAITAENVMKWETLHPQADRFEWFFGDTLADFAGANQQKFRGHTLVWHSQLPQWVKDTVKTRDAMLDLVRTHSAAIADHYKGRVHKWDVVNEVIDDTEGFRKSEFYTLTGTDFIDEAFRAAHGADPDALLYINDYSVEHLGPKSDRLYQLCADLVSRKVPIHGVGLQAHLDLDQMPGMDSFRKNIERFTALGLQVDITELDIRFSGPATPERLAAQAQAYRDVFEVILTTEGTDSVTLWGLDDGHSWIPKWRPGVGNALLLDRKYQPKPAYWAVAEVLGR